MTLDECIREQLGDHYEYRRVLTLRLIVAHSDPDIRSKNNKTRYTAVANKSNLTHLIWMDWRGNRGPQRGRIFRWVEFQVIEPMTVDEMVAVREEAFRLLSEALPPLVTA